MSHELSPAVMETLDRLSADLADKRRIRSDRRSRGRQSMQVDCIVHFFGQRTDEVVTLSGRTRNISRGGIGLVVPRSFYQDEPVEIQISLPDRETMYMAGLVRFCRYVIDGFFEVGVQLAVAGHEPIFALNPAKAARQYSWMAAAMAKMSARAFSSEVARPSSSGRSSPERLLR
jgi:hypothetical protein